MRSRFRLCSPSCAGRFPVPRNEVAGGVCAAAALLLVAVFSRSASTRHLELNFGPGDSAFVSGFEDDREVEDKVGWHWTTYDARVDLPFEADGGPLDLTLRYARMFGEEAVVEVGVAQARVGTFRARGGETRSTTLRTAPVQGPVAITIETDSHERRNRGLRMDHLAVDSPSGPPLRLKGSAAARPVVGVALLIAGLLVLGSSVGFSGAAGLVAAMVFAVRASTDLFGAWRQIYLVPQMLIISTLVLWGGRRWLERTQGVDPKAASRLCSAGLVVVLFRLVLLSHPDFYYPDLLTHARVVSAMRAEGPAFFLDPAQALAAQGAWTKPVMGASSSLPYAIMFHLPFAVMSAGLDLTTDQVETAIKAGSSLISVLPVLVAAALAARLGLPPLGAMVLCLIPTYTSRLSFALLPALFGHVFDLLALLAIARAIERDQLKSARSFLLVAMALLAGHLAYTSSVVNEGLFVAIFAALGFVQGPKAAGLSLRLLGAEAVAALLALALYYRHFLGDVAGLLARLTGLGLPVGAVAESVYPIESFWALLWERTSTFFPWPYVALATLGLVLGSREARQSRVVQAWGIGYLVLILLRAKIPDVFRYGHETLFFTPLVAIFAGAGLTCLWRLGKGSRLATGAAAFVLVMWSFRMQFLAVSEQLGNAR